MRPTSQSIAYNLEAADLYLQNARTVRAEQRRLRNSAVFVFQYDGRVTREVNRLVRGRSQTAIAYLLRAVCMIRAGSRNLA